jgi:hypothetical protein
MIAGSRSEVQMETVTLILSIPFWHQDSMPELKAILFYFCTHFFSSFFMYRIIISHDGIDDAWLQKPSISKSYHATPSHLFSTTISHVWGWVLTRRQQYISSAHVRYSFTASPDSKVQLGQICSSKSSSCARSLMQSSRVLFIGAQVTNSLPAELEFIVGFPIAKWQSGMRLSTCCSLLPIHNWWLPQTVSVTKSSSFSTGW